MAFYTPAFRGGLQGACHIHIPASAPSRGCRIPTEAPDHCDPCGWLLQDAQGHTDRKSTRLNSSHGSISYAVFCLKKKNHDSPHISTSAGEDSELDALECDPPTREPRRP